MKRLLPWVLAAALLGLGASRNFGVDIDLVGGSGLKVGGTSVIDSSRAATVSALVSTGAITSSGLISANGGLSVTPLTSTANAPYQVIWQGAGTQGTAAQLYTTTGFTFNPVTGAFAVPGAVSGGNGSTFTDAGAGLIVRRANAGPALLLDETGAGASTWYIYKANGAAGGLIFAGPGVVTAGTLSTAGALSLGAGSWTLAHDASSGYAKFSSGLVVTNTAALDGGATTGGVRWLESDRSATFSNLVASVATLTNVEASGYVNATDQLRTNGTARIDGDGDLVNIATITASGVVASGGHKRAARTITADYTATLNDEMIYCDVTNTPGGLITVTLPAASTAIGHHFQVWRLLPVIGTHSVVVTAAGSDKINNAINISQTEPFFWVDVVGASSTRFVGRHGNGF